MALIERNEEATRWNQPAAAGESKRKITRSPHVVCVLFDAFSPPTDISWLVLWLQGKQGGEAGEEEGGGKGASRSTHKKQEKQKQKKKKKKKGKPEGIFVIINEVISSRLLP